MSYSFILKDFNLIHREWNKVYRHNGGLAALARCLHGTNHILSNDFSFPQIRSSGEIECLTFSVVPLLTILWSFYIKHALVDTLDQTIIGDCSGNLQLTESVPSTKVYPLLNYAHGEKLDLFLQKVCSSKFILICDDDIFWLDQSPIAWALDKLKEDPKTVVVSLMPRGHSSELMQEKVGRPMGSYCLVINRELWLKENLSFRIVKPPSELGYDYFYDTADYAQRQILERGYQVVIAPPEIRSSLITFEGVSSWYLRIQRHAGNINKYIQIDPKIRPEKALRVIVALRGFIQLAIDQRLHLPVDYLIPPQFLAKAEKQCQSLLVEHGVGLLQLEVERKLNILRNRFLLSN